MKNNPGGLSATWGSVILGAAAMLLLALITFFRMGRPETRPLGSLPPHPIGENPQEPLPPVPAPEASSPDPSKKAKLIKPDSLLPRLAEALEKGDEKGARLLLESLRGTLFPSTPGGSTAATKYGLALDMIPQLLPKPPGNGREIREALRSDHPTDSQRELLRQWFAENKDSLGQLTRLLVDASGLPLGEYARNPDGEPISPAPFLRLQDAASILGASARYSEGGAKS